MWNRTPKKALGMKTPFEECFNSKPNIAELHQFGSPCFVTRVPQSKLAERAIEGRWVGLDPESKGHRIYWPNQRSITVECDIVFSLHEIPRIEGEHTEIDWEMQ